MKKIVTLFARNHDGDRLVRDEVMTEALWVFTGDGVATQKFDGTCCLVRDGQLFKRYDAKQGKAWPPGFEPAQDADPVTGHQPGWLPVGDGPEDAWHREAFAQLKWARQAFPNMGISLDGTYELCGPKVQGNPERCEIHALIRHGIDEIRDVPRTFAELRAYLSARDIEGIVWHHPDGRMVKIKQRDFGLRRGAP